MDADTIIGIWVLAIIIGVFSLAYTACHRSSIEDCASSCARDSSKRVMTKFDGVACECGDLK